MQEKWIVWGTGLVGQKLYELLVEKECVENVTAVVDSDKNKWGKSWNGFEVQDPDIIRKDVYDKIIIAVETWRGLCGQILEKYHIGPDRIDNYMFIQRRAMLEFYQQKQHKPEELEKQIQYICTHPLGVFNDDFVDKYTELEIEVHRDEKNDMFYVLHFGKKMYFPKKFKKAEVMNYYRQIIMEQDVLSPHRYQSDEFSIKEGEVILDAGAAEGNFSLEVVDKVKSLYLVEADEAWIEALTYTFEPYKGKVHIIQKYLTDNCNDRCITIDELAKNETFTSIKMDIEGAEISALAGGEKTLRSQPLNAYICSYHRERDFDDIANMMRHYGYNISTTNGYMVFLSFRNLKQIPLPKLVRGVIRASK